MRAFWLSMGLAYGAALGAPFAVTDVHDGSLKPTHCGILLDTALKVEVPVQADPAGVFCKFDLDPVPPGAHVMKARFIVKDSLWGTKESGDSNIVNFTKPGAPPPPSGLTIRP